MANSPIVCVINRGERARRYMKNGVQYTLVPGENHILGSHVRFAKEQNPIMGTQNPANPRKFQSWIALKPAPGIKSKDDCSQVIVSQDENGRAMYVFENGKEIPVSVERIDRTQLGGRRRNAVVEAAEIVIDRYSLEGEGDVSNVQFDGR